MTLPAPVTPAGSSSPAGVTRIRKKFQASSHRTIRYREESGFEAKCLYCGDWWPLTLEFWKPRGGLARCKACWMLYHRLREQGRRADELVHEARRQAERARYHANRQKYNASARRWREANREHVAAYNKAYREKNREALKATRRAYYADAGEVIRLKKRVRYYDRKVQEAAA